jgi:2-iminobutanoate/2-iminopropanoate deaminase
MVYTSGSLPVVPETGKDLFFYFLIPVFLTAHLYLGNVIEGGIAEQTQQSLSNIVEVLKASGSGLDKVVKTTVFLKDMNDFVAMNDVYAKVQ